MPMSPTHASASLSAKQCDALLHTLRGRFEKHLHRHKGIAWSEVREAIEGNAKALQSLHRMEETGGEPDVIGFASKGETFAFVDCASESPKGRRSLCYDRRALAARKEHKPKDSVLDLADAMGIELLTEEQYRALQELEAFDTKTSSWIHTPPAIRTLGGALFCDRRYGAVFTYHNGAESYYAARGFRGVLRV